MSTLPDADLEARLRTSLHELAATVEYDAPPPSSLPAVRVAKSPREPRSRVCIAGFALAVASAAVVVGVVAFRGATTHPRVDITPSSTPPTTTGRGSVALPAADPITAMPKGVTGLSRDAALLRLGYAAGTPMLPVANGSGAVAGYVRSSYLVGPKGGGPYPSGMPGYPITGLDGDTLYGYFLRDLGAVPRSIAEFPSRLALVRRCNGSADSTKDCVDARANLNKPFGVAVLVKKDAFNGRMLANEDGHPVGFIAQFHPHRDPKDPTKISLWPTDLDPPILDRQLVLVVNKQGEVVGYTGNGTGFISLATATQAGFDIEAYRAHRYGDCVDHQASAAAHARFPYCPSSPRWPDGANARPDQLANTRWDLESITDASGRHTGTATLRIGRGTIAWTVCSNATRSAPVRFTEGIMYVHNVRGTLAGCNPLDSYFDRLFDLGRGQANSWFVDKTGTLHLVDPTNRLFMVFSPGR